MPLQSNSKTSPSQPQPVYVGVDVGASRTKVAVLDRDKNMIGHAVGKSGTDFSETADNCLTDALEASGALRQDIIRTVSTGYGRKNVLFAQASRTEIGCHGRGCFHYFPSAITVIDIGGQDNKIIKLDPHGKRISFKMNRKCAAGTGAFLEEMAARLDISIDRMDGLTRQSEHMVEMGSYCTVFTATEVLEKIRQGIMVPDIVKGLFFSVVKRIMEMDSLTERVVMTGGVVAHNPFLVTMVQEVIGREVLVPDFPQMTGAVGAALFAIDED